MRCQQRQGIRRGTRGVGRDEPRRLPRCQRRCVQRLLGQHLPPGGGERPASNHSCSHQGGPRLRPRRGGGRRRLGGAAFKATSGGTLPRRPRRPRARGGWGAAGGHLCPKGPSGVGRRMNRGRGASRAPAATATAAPAAARGNGRPAARTGSGADKAPSRRIERLLQRAPLQAKVTPGGPVGAWATNSQGRNARRGRRCQPACHGARGGVNYAADQGVHPLPGRDLKK